MKNNYLKPLSNKLVWVLLLCIGEQELLAQTPFNRRLAIPDLYNRRNDTLFVDAESHNFGPTALNNVSTFAYNHLFSGSNSYLGPTLTWIKGDPQNTNIQNRFTAGPRSATTFHVQGAIGPAWALGGPRQSFESGSSYDVKIPTVQNYPSTLWYHPNPADFSTNQLQMGLSGLVIVRENGDPVAAISPSTYGHDDIPLVIQDVKFTNGQIDTTQGNTDDHVLIVNGGMQTFWNFWPQPNRFRLVNASTRNTYHFAFVSEIGRAHV